MDDILDELLRRLPTPPGPLWLGGPDESHGERHAATVRQRLREAGYSLLSVDDHRPQPSAATGGEESAPRYSLAVWIGAPPNIAQATALRHHLATGARLMIVSEEMSPTQARESAPGPLVIALSEAGFALRNSFSTGDRRRIFDARAMPFVLRSWSPGDEERIADLFERAFHHRRPLEHWRWQYLHNPTQVPTAASVQDPTPEASATVASGTVASGTVASSTPEPCISLAFDGDELVAHYAAYPVSFRDARDPNRPRRFVALHVGDTMTAQRVRAVGRGPTSVLARCGHYLFARYSQGRVAFNFGVNEGNIQRFSMRYFDGHRARGLEYWRLDLAGGALPPGALGDPSRLGRRVVEFGDSSLEPPDSSSSPPLKATLHQQLDDLFERLAPQLGVLVERDAQHLRWRYLQRPGFDYRLFLAFEGERLAGWSVLRREGQRLLWGDALLPARGFQWIVSATLVQACKGPLGAGARTLEAWFPANLPQGLGQWLGQLGFRRLPEPQQLALICAPFEDRQAPELLREAFYSLGDSDLF